MIKKYTAWLECARYAMELGAGVNTENFWYA